MTRPGLLDPAPDVAAHLRRHGSPRPVTTLQIAHAGILGCGGGEFPLAAKLTAVADATATRGRTPVVIGNGAETDPLSRKDRVLLRTAPHLVLDGLDAVADLLRTESRHLVVHDDAFASLVRALTERRGRPPVALHHAAPGFVAGQETALIAALTGRPAVPFHSAERPTRRGLGGAPTLVVNVETLAHVALLSRGRPFTTRLVSVTLGPTPPRVLAVPRTTRLRELVPPRRPVLIGGHHGTWVDADADAPLDRLDRLGARLGTGALLVPATDVASTTAALLDRLAAETAGRCGPCRLGLPALATAWRRFIAGAPGARDDVRAFAGLLPGRGACTHPDGSARLVASALAVIDAPAMRHGAPSEVRRAS